MLFRQRPGGPSCCLGALPTVPAGTAPQVYLPPGDGKGFDWDMLAGGRSPGGPDGGGCGVVWWGWGWRGLGGREQAFACLAGPRAGLQPAHICRADPACNVPRGAGYDEVKRQVEETVILALSHPEASQACSVFVCAALKDSA